MHYSTTAYHQRWTQGRNLWQCLGVWYQRHHLGCNSFEKAIIRFFVHPSHQGCRDLQTAAEVFVIKSRFACFHDSSGFTKDTGCPWIHLANSTVLKIWIIIQVYWSLNYVKLEVVVVKKDLDLAFRVKTGWTNSDSSCCCYCTTQSLGNDSRDSCWEPDRRHDSWL